MLNTEIQLAQKIITGSYSPLKNKCFHKSSFIYKTTNEYISSYKDLITDKENIFSIIASGDQILNSILLGTKQVTGCDVSSFPKHFLNLKIAAILSLTLNEYINFFIEKDSNGLEFSYDYYQKLSKNLNSNSLKFWNHLFNFFDGDEIYNSMLFSHELYNLESIREKNLYLEKENYELLKRKLLDIKIKYIEQDLSDYKFIDNNSYDLVNLSSIIYYGDLSNPENYDKLMKRFNLTENGMIISYLNDIYFKNKFISNSYSYKDLDKNNTSIMVYQKKK